jgi:hypothetical protein
MMTFGHPDSSGIPKPPPAVNGLKTMVLAVSRENGAVVISAPFGSARTNASEE